MMRFRRRIRSGTGNGILGSGGRDVPAFLGRRGQGASPVRAPAFPGFDTSGSPIPVNPAFPTPPPGCYSADMTFPYPLPDWLPWWVPVAVLVPALLYLLVFLMMPFSVFGVKGRLDAIEERLDEIQAELRTLVLRLPEVRGGGVASSWADPPPPIAPLPREEDDRRTRPPIPHAPVHVPRRPPLPQVEPVWRPAPDPRSRPARPIESNLPDRTPPNDDGDARSATPRAPGSGADRPPRSEPRLDWPR
jgi:hypothetical protein